MRFFSELTCAPARGKVFVRSCVNRSFVLASSLVTAVKALYDRGLAHNDLHSRNVMIRPHHWAAVLIDPNMTPQKGKEDVKQVRLLRANGPGASAAAREVQASPCASNLATLTLACVTQGLCACRDLDAIKTRLVRAPKDPSPATLCSPYFWWADDLR